MRMRQPFYFDLSAVGVHYTNILQPCGIKGGS